jgi:phosphoglycerol transferase MdoB-like AlkP superfamily enzyme
MHALKYLLKRLAPYFLFFIAIQLIIRALLAGYSWMDMSDMGARIPAAFLIGFMYDVMVFVYLAIPVALYALLLPQRFQGQRIDSIISAALFFIFIYVLMFSSTGEWFFWDEFQSRYNFIAVDYLVYTTEVIGNIRESYPVEILMSAMAGVSLLLSYGFYKYSPRILPLAPPFKKRAWGFASLLLLAVFSFTTMRGSFAEISQNRILNEVARNGIFELFSAYRNNTLDYKSFYVSRPNQDVVSFLHEKIGSGKDPESPLTHTVKGAGNKKYNLVLITVESLSANFLKTFGNDKDITPHLDKLIGDSLFFSNLYATGTRTVYGLSSLTLSIPPIPGNSIVRRPENGNLFSLGHVLKSQGYTTKFIYGGFGYFDNMNEFFAANGYEIVDRNDLSEGEITFANIWGVADEDLYRRVIKENDEAYAAGRPFFDMVMTTSNHRPFTFPEGRIDIPSHTGRAGGVKYTDYAINEFLQEAKKRPWFDNTIFVIVADHTSSSAGKSELDPNKYHIPMWIYAPGIIKPGTIDWMASQIDVPPTILGLMGIGYESRFYGKDLLKERPDRVFISNYQQLGYMTKKGLIILKPVGQTDFYTRTGKDFERGTIPEDLLNEAIFYFQGASQWREWSHNKGLQSSVFITD